MPCGQDTWNHGRYHHLPRGPLPLSHNALTCLSFNPKSNTSSIIVNLGILSYSLPILPFS